jgi:hypothetical protein
MKLKTDPVAWMDSEGNVVEEWWLSNHEAMRVEFPVALYTADQLTAAYHCGRESKEAELSVEAGK